MKIKNASSTCSALRSFRRIFAQQAAKERLSTAVGIVSLASGSVVMPLTSAHPVAMVGIPSSRSSASRRSSPDHVPKIRCGRIPVEPIRRSSPEHIPKIRWAYPFRPCINACRTRYRPLDGPWLNFAHRRGSPHWPGFGPLPPQPFLKPSSKRPSSVTGANICGSSTPMMNCPLLSASIPEIARASPDMLSGPERFLKQVGPQIIAYLPIAVSSTNVTGDAQPVTRRSTLLSTPFASLESRFCSSYLCRVVPPATRRKFNCVGLARKSIFGVARFQSTTVHHDIARHLVHLAACNETNFRLN